MSQEKQEENNKQEGRKFPAPLLTCVLVSALVFCAGGVLGKHTVYAQYEMDPVYEPYLSLVFRGAAQDVYPWGEKTSSGELEAMKLLSQAEPSEPETSGEARDTAPSAPEDDIAQSGEMNGPETSGETPEPGTSGSFEEPENTDNTADPEETESQEAFSENDAPGASGETEEILGTGSVQPEEELPDSVVLGEEILSREEAVHDILEQADTLTEVVEKYEEQEEAKEQEELSSVSSMAQSPEKPAAPHVVYTIDTDGITEAVCSPVVPAVEYGNVNAGYLFADRQTPEKDPDPVFAENGVYYPLREVDDTYFADALFIGDSRTHGLYLYSKMKGITSFICKESVSVFNIYDRALPLFAPGKGEIKKTVLETLQEQQYRKVYVSVGVNELGSSSAEYFSRFKDLVRIIRQLQPEAIIYVQGIMHVTGSYAQKNAIYNNTNIVGRNQALATLANGHDIFYIDMNSAVCDEDGNIPEALAYDGVHLKASSYELWHRFLLENAIVRSRADWPEGTADETAHEGEEGTSPITVENYAE